MERQVPETTVSTSSTSIINGLLSFIMKACI